MTILALAFLVFLLALPSLAGAATYYVSPSGTSSSCVAGGQATNQMRNTINGGIGCLSAGDTLIVKNGTYAGNLNTPPSGINNAARTVIQAENARQAVVNLGSGHTDGLGLTGRSNITIQGLVFDGGPQSNRGYAIRFGAGVTNVTLDNLEIKNILSNNSADNSGGIGFGFIDTSPNILISNSYIHDLGSDDTSDRCSSCFTYGTYASTNGTTFENNIFQNISSYAIHMYDDFHNSMNNNIIRNNIFINTGTLLIAETGTGNQVYNNVLRSVGTTVFGFDRNGIRLTGNNNVLYNNTIVDGGFGAGGGGKNCISMSGSGNTVRNNICYGNAVDTIAGTAGNVVNTNLLGANPSFVNPGGGDYHLQAGSLAVDTGATIALFATDLEGGPRPQGAAWDLGAYERGTPPPSGPVTIYVSAGGHSDTPSDSNTCTQAQTITTPKATVAAGMACASAAGSTVRIRGGLYTQPTIRTSLLPTPLVGGTDWNTPTTIEAYNGETVTIRANGSSFGALYFDAGANDHYIVLQGLILDAANLGDSALIADNGAHHLRFQNGELRNAAFSVVYLENVNNIEVLSSIIENSTTFPLIQIVGTSADALIQGNTIRNATASQALVVAGTAPRATVRKNQIYTVGGSSVSAIDAAGDDFLMVNNFVWGSYAGLKLSSGAANAKIYNNTIVGNTTYGMQLDATSTGVQVINNIVAENGTAQITNNTGATLTTNLTTTPGFANAGAGDFHLTQSSVNAIDMGTTLASDVPDDIWGHTRSGVWDIGADEFQGTPVTPPAFSSANPAIGMFLAY
jgi:hypothetical protein